jgi:hypothetical protein
LLTVESPHGDRVASGVVIEERGARWCFATTSAVVTFGLVLQVILAARNEEGAFATVPARIVNTLSFFTVLSNILVALTLGLLAYELFRTSVLVRVLRVTGLVAIAITGVVFHLALRNLHELSGKEALADFILHTFSPVASVALWALVGPRNQISRRIVILSVVFPLVWLTYALVRGAVVDDKFGNDYYPYPFLNVAHHGYPSVFVSVALVAALFLVIAASALALDSRLPGLRRPGDERPR